MLALFNNQELTNQSDTEISSHCSEKVLPLKQKPPILVNVQKNEPLHNVGKNINLYINFGKQYGDSWKENTCKQNIRLRNTKPN